MLEVSVVIPALNEEKGVGVCIKKIQDVFSYYNIYGEIIIVDNGSNDRTAEIAEKAGAFVVHESRRGYGNAYRTGFKFAKGDIIVMGDADNSYDFYDIPKLLKEIENGYDLVIGSRFLGKMEDGAMSGFRKSGNSFLRLLLRINGLKIKETCTGFTCFRKSILENLNLSSEGMEFSSEFLIKTSKKGFKIKEVPIIYHRRIGKSKLNEFKDGLRHLNLITQEFLRR